MRDALADALATYRLTRLITEDEFPPVAHLRERVLERFGPLHWASYLVTCPFCMSVWIGTGVVLARKLARRPWSTLAQALASASLGAFLVQLEHQLQNPSLSVGDLRLQHSHLQVTTHEGAPTHIRQTKGSSMGRAQHGG